MEENKPIDNNKSINNDKPIDKDKPAKPKMKKNRARSDRRIAGMSYEFNDSYCKMDAPTNIESNKTIKDVISTIDDIVNPKPEKAVRTDDHGNPARQTSRLKEIGKPELRYLSNRKQEQSLESRVLRQYLIEKLITKHDFEAVYRELLDLCLTKSVAQLPAIRVYLSYVLGNPDQKIEVSGDMKYSSEKAEEHISKFFDI